MKEYIGNY